MCRYIISGIARDAFHMNNFYVIYYIYISYFFVDVFLFYGMNGAPMVCIIMALLNLISVFI